MMVVLKVSVPSRGFGSDDTGRGALTATAHMFPSPLGVLGLTTSDSISPGGQQISHVSVPSRGFGSDDRPVAARLPPPLLTWFPSPLGVLGLTTRKSTRAGVERCPVSVPSRGFGSDDH
ncbi:hypothetical protein X081_02845 [Mycobacterium tuberculosis BTB04-001]|nr:hypothetical protein X081_02845 [Mycobacterium tuberculosis BTB04-001]